MFGHPSGVDALFRWEVPALRVRPQEAQAVSHGVCQAPIAELPQPVPQGGRGDPSEARHLPHCGQGRGAHQQQCVLKLLGQGAGGRVPSPDWLPGNQIPCGRFDSLGAPANGVDYGAGNCSPHVAPFQEAPERVAGDAQGLGRLPAAVPQDVGSHVAADSVVEVAVR